MEGIKTAFERNLRRLFEDFFKHEYLKPEIIRLKSWKEAGVIRDAESAFIGFFFGQVSRDVERIGYELSMPPDGMREQFNLLFAEYLSVNKEDIRLMFETRDERGRFIS